MLAQRHQQLLVDHNLFFASPQFSSGLQENFKDFDKHPQKEQYRWVDDLTSMCNQPGKKWLQDIYTVYTPMIWKDKHWVGLVIKLDIGLVEILDPLPTLYKDVTVQRCMKPVLNSLPYLLKQIANPNTVLIFGLFDANVFLVYTSIKDLVTAVP